MLPKTLPSPFLELARHCLQADLQRRWTVAEILTYLRKTASAPEGQSTASLPAMAKPRYLVPAVALGLVLAVVLAASLFNRQPKADRTSSVRVQEEPARKPVTPEAGRSMKKTNGRQQREVVQEVLPEVPQNARDTIRGKVRVRVRVLVDPSGTVVNAKFDSAGPSRYFAELALKAAQRWKFRPTRVDDVSSEWIVLRFDFTKAGTKALLVRAAL